MRTMAYKYRRNIDIRQDTFSLLRNEFYAPTLVQLNDPFERTIIEFIRSFSLKNGYIEINEVINKIKNEIGIYSLSKKNGIPDSELLWAHYANSHKGFCIEYDVDLLMDNELIPPTVHKFDVIYEDINRAKIAKFSHTEVLKSLLGYKSKAWEYENEIRLVFDKSGVKPYHPSAVKSVFFGLFMASKEKEIIQKGLEGVNVDFYEMVTKEGEYGLEAKLIARNTIYVKDRLPKEIYEIIGEPEILPKVQNFNVLYKDSDKSHNALQYFVSKFRDEHAIKASNITIVDDIRAIELFDISRELTHEEKIFLSEHWIAYSPFEAPEDVYIYPDKAQVIEYA